MNQHTACMHAYLPASATNYPLFLLCTLIVTWTLAARNLKFLEYFACSKFIPLFRSEMDRGKKVIIRGLGSEFRREISRVKIVTRLSVHKWCRVFGAISAGKGVEIFFSSFLWFSWPFQIDDDRNSSTQLQREVQSLQESCEELQKKNDKLQHDLATKENQVVLFQVSYYL